MLRTFIIAIALIATCPFALQGQTSWSGGSLVDSNWLTDDNWVGAAPSGGSLIFTGTSRLDNVNNNTADTEFTGIRFDDSGSAAGNFVLNSSGSRIEFDGDIIVDTATASTQTIGLDLLLTSDLDLAVDVDSASADGSTLSITGDITDGGNGFSLTVADALADTAGGTGVIILSGDNTYSGGTTIEENTVRILTANSIGTSGITLLDGSGGSSEDPELQLADGVVLTNAITISNTGNDKRLSLSSAGAQTGESAEFAGMITINEAGNANFEINAGGNINNDTTQVLTLSGQITGSGPDTTEVAIRITGGDGTIILSNTSNDFVGNIQLDQNGATLRVVSDEALSNAELILNQTNSVVELANGVTVDNVFTANSANGNKVLRLEEGTGLTAEYSGAITVLEETQNNFDLDANSTGGNSDETQVLTISGPITSVSGAGLALTGDGVVRLTGDNNISDNIDMSTNGSFLRVGHNNALGGAGGATVLLDNNNTTLQLESGIVTNASNNLIVDVVGTTGKELTVFDEGGEESAEFAGNIDLQDDTANAFSLRAGTDDTLTVSGVISGTTTATTAGIDKIGEGIVILSGANTYIQETRLENGTLQANAVDVAGVSGALGNGGIIRFEGGVLQYTALSSGADWATRFQNSSNQIRLDTNGQDVVLTDVIDATNTGGLRKAGAGTLTLSGNNAFTGINIVEGGTLLLGASDVLSETGALGVGREVSTLNAIFDLNGNNQTVDSLSLGGGNAAVGGLNASIIDSIGTGVLTIDGGITYNDGGANLNGQAVISADIDLNGSFRTLNVQDGANDVDLIISGNITNAGNTINKTSAGTVRFTGTNNFSSLNIDNGTLQVESIDALGTNRISLGDNSDNGTFEWIGGAATINNQIRVGNSNAGETGTGTITNSGSGTLTFDRNLFNQIGSLDDVAKVLTINGTSDIVIEGEFRDNSALGTLGLTKGGSNNLTLSDTNTYTGPTTLNSGTLTVDGEIGSSSTVTVNGGTLAGIGTIGGATTFTGGTLNAGNSGDATGTLTFAGGLTTGSATWLIDLVEGDANNSDFIDVSATGTVLDITNSVLSLQTTGSFVVGTSYRIASFETLTSTFSGLGEGAIISGYEISYGVAESGFITLTAVPEPQTLLFLLLVAVVTILGRRRKRLESPEGGGSILKS